MRKWRIEDSEELYNVTGWGTSYFGINDKGHVVVTPRKDGVAVDLKELVDELQLRDVAAPVLVRFPDILDNRIEKVSCCFRQAADEYGYKGENFIIYPIKVNQMRPVVEEMITHGKKFNLGLEAGSKPELHAVIGVNTDSSSLVVCNGYKDESFIELALLAQKMGKRIFLVVEKLNELNLIAKMAKQLKVRPNIGIRIKLASSGSGKWEESGGDASKFGLTSSELLEALDFLEKKEMKEKEIKENRLHFGMVFQSFNLFPQYSVFENVVLAPELLLEEKFNKFKKPEKNKTARAEFIKSEKAKIAKEAEELLEKTGLSEKRNSYPCELSGGQCQRVAIARALALKPRVLCFDEPTSALDPELTGEVLNVIKSLKNENRTMIIVTHEMGFAKNISDKVVFMADGVICEEGTPQNLFSNPQTDKLKSFLKNVHDKDGE